MEHPIDWDDDRVASVEELISMLRSEGTPVPVGTPGEVTEDCDGIPAWVGPPGFEVVSVAGHILRAADWRDVTAYLLAQVDELEAERGRA